MSRSQATFGKKQREKDRAKKKKEKAEKRAARKENSGGGVEIDWSAAPENKTLTEAEIRERDKNEAANKNKNS